MAMVFGLLQNWLMKKKMNLHLLISRIARARGSRDQKELKFKTDIGNALSAGSVFIIKLKLILHLQNHFDPSQLF